MGREGGQLQHLRGVQGVLGLAEDEGRAGGADHYGSGNVESNGVSDGRVSRKAGNFQEVYPVSRQVAMPLCGQNMF